MLRQVIAEKAANVKEEREILEQQMALLKRQSEPMKMKLKEIEMSADRATRRVLWSIASIMITQFSLIQYGTYIAFSWDIMEPITCGMTMGDSVVAYLFWMWSKQPYSLNGIRNFFFERKKNKLIKKKLLDYDNYLKTEQAIEIIQNRLDEL